MNNREYEAQRELKVFFEDALKLQKEKRDGGYGESWQEGRPVGITDNLGWIIQRIKNMEKKLDTLEVTYSTSEKTSEELEGVFQQMSHIRHKIEDDLLDLVNFAGFRWVMNNDERDLV